jgi:glycosyltransferase involved in cell wall biosynthesis
LNIVLPVHHFPPRYTAGAEQYTLNLARWLRARGDTVTVVAFESIDSGSRTGIDAVRTEHEGIPVWRLSMDLMRAPERERWTYYNEPLERWFARLLRDERPDLLHFQAGYLMGVAPVFAARAAGITTGITLHDYWYLCPRHTLLRGDDALCESIPESAAECVWCHDYLWSSRKRKLHALTGGAYHALALRTMPRKRLEQGEERRRLAAEALAAMSFVIAPSAYLHQRMRVGVAPSKLHQIRYGLPLARFEQARSTPRDADAPLTIGYIGQIAHHKGVHLLIEAFRALKPGVRPLALHVYGGLNDTAYVDRLRALAAGDARIQFKGRFEHADAPAVYRACDVTVAPSIWYENLPLAILEAYAAGTPVVTASTGGMSEPVAHNANGMHFALGDARALARELQRLCDDPALLARLQQGALDSPPGSTDDELRQVAALYESHSESATAAVEGVTA